jgi:RNA polymerase sigma factor (sigma-70 family)
LDRKVKGALNVPNQSISRWIQEVKCGSEEAAFALWERYFPDLIRLSQRRLQNVRRTVEDEEDVAAQVLKSFFSGARQNRFPKLADRDGLWRLLCRITRDKAVDLVRRRSRDAVVDGTDLDQIPGTAHSTLIGDFDELTCSLADLMTNEVRRLLDTLGDEQLKQIAVSKFANCTNREIADQLGCAERTVERRLELIRVKWKSELDS